MRKGWLRGAGLLLVSLSVAFAEDYGKIVGRIVDAETGDPLVGSAVTLKETRQGVAADLNGYYVILRVSPGSYTVEGQMLGYGPVSKKGVRVEAGRTVELNFSLTSGAIMTEVIEVVSEPIIKKDVTASVNMIRAEKIDALPVTNLTDVIVLQAGVKVTSAGFIQVRGGRPGEVAFLVDGAEIRDPYSGFQDLSVPLDAVQETAVNKGGFGAEYGSAGSGVISIATKEGKTNYEFTLNVRSSNLSTLGSGAYDIFDANPGDPYIRYFQPEYFKTYDTTGMYNNTDKFGFDNVMEYEKARLAAYKALRDAGSHPDAQLQHPYLLYGEFDGDSGYTIPVGHKEKYNRYQFSLGGPLPGYDKLRFFGSYDFTGTKTRFPYGGGPETSDNLKLTWQPSDKWKFFASTVGWRQFNTNYSPNYRLAFGHLAYEDQASRQYVAGVNWLFSYKTYTELRVGYFDTKRLNNVFEDIDLDGWDDYADRDNDGRIEVDPEAIQDSLGKIIDPNFITEWGPDSEWVELNYFWYENEAAGMYPSLLKGRSRSDYLVVTKRGGGDTLTLDEGDKVTFDSLKAMWGDSASLDTILRIGDIYTPDKYTWSRSIWHYDRKKVLNVRYDLVSQDYLNLKDHNLKTGMEYTNYNILNESQDYASGGNYYPDINRAAPWKSAIYARDKMEFQGMIANIGLRFDYFEPNGYIPEDPMNPMKVKGEPNAIDSFIWFNDEVRKDTMFLLNPQKAPVSWYLSPRVGISHPITENDVLHFTYGHYFQTPNMRFLYMNNYYLTTGAFPLMGNPGLKPEKTISYEIGVKHAFTGAIVVDLTAFYKDVSDLVQSIRYDNYSINDTPTTNNYTTFLNQDFASVRGFEIEFSKLKGGFLPYLSLDVNYTFQVAKGSFSSAFSSYSSSWARLPLSYSEEHYLDWDERNQVSTIISWDMPPTKSLLSNWGTALIYTYGSGTPWSPTVRDIRDALELTNTLRMPAQSGWDMRLYKGFRFGRAGLKLFANVYNVFNNLYVTSFNDREVYEVFGDPEAEVKDPRVWNTRRLTRIGFQLTWGH